MQIHTILTHTRPHVDELLAIWLLRFFGGSIFQGIQNAKIEFITNGMLPKSETAESLLEKGTLCIGVGGGMFDEHATANSDRKDMATATSLVSEHLKLETKSSWVNIKRLIDHIFANDTKGAVQGKDDLSCEIKKMLRLSQETAMRFSQDAFLVLYENPQMSFSTEGILNFLNNDDFITFYSDSLAYTKSQWREAIKELKGAQTIEFIGPHGPLKIIVMHTENFNAGSVARSKKYGNANIAIIINDRGNTTILPRASDLLDMSELVMLLRLEEEYLDGQVGRTSIDQITNEKVDGPASRWYYFVSPGNKHFQLILNGSETTPNIEATKINAERIIHLIQIALDVDFFATECKNPQCVRSECCWDVLDLRKCSRVRATARSRS